MKVSPALTSYLQIGPLLLVLLLFFGIPLLVVIAFSFFEFDGINTIPAFDFVNYIDVFDLRSHAVVVSEDSLLRCRGMGDHSGGRIHGCLFPGLPRAEPDLADGAVPVVHRAVLDLEHHSHDLVDSVSRQERDLQQGADRRRASRIEPLEFLLFSDFAVIIAYVHLFTLFMIVPIFNSMARIESLIEAARDGGASAWRIIWDIVVPLSKTGIALGSIFVVTLVMGDFFVVKVMSGSQTASVAIAMSNQIAMVQYPPAAASAVILLIVVSLMVATILRIVDVRKEIAG